MLRNDYFELTLAVITFSVSAVFKYRPSQFLFEMLKSRQLYVARYIWGDWLWLQILSLSLGGVFVVVLRLPSSSSKHKRRVNLEIALHYFNAESDYPIKMWKRSIISIVMFFPCRQAARSSACLQATQSLMKKNNTISSIQEVDIFHELMKCGVVSLCFLHDEDVMKGNNSLSWFDRFLPAARYIF